MTALLAISGLFADSLHDLQSAIGNHVGFDTPRPFGVYSARGFPGLPPIARRA
jgi:hypothetical protein